jgi:hypothetical protein
MVITNPNSTSSCIIYKKKVFKVCHFINAQNTKEEETNKKWQCQILLPVRYFNISGTNSPVKRHKQDNWLKT